MKNIIIYFLLFVVYVGNAQTGISYQGVLRTTSGEPLTNEIMDIRFRLLPDTLTPQSFDFEEIHRNVTTDDFGVFSAVIGSVDPVPFFSLNFSQPYFIEVSIRLGLQGSFRLLHRTALSSSAYAMHALTAENVDDADADPLNEIQVLEFNAINNTLSISGGNEVTIATSGNGADADPENELQQLSKQGDRIRLSQGGGEVIDMVEDADADPGNELQRLSISGSKLKLSRDGGEVELPSFESPWNSSKLNHLNTDRSVIIGESSDQLVSPYPLNVLGPLFLSESIVTPSTTISLQEGFEISQNGALLKVDEDGTQIAHRAVIENTMVIAGNSIQGGAGSNPRLVLQPGGGDLGFFSQGGGKLNISGKVQIGRTWTNPTHELHVKHLGSSNGSTGIKIENDGSNKNWWSLYTANGSGQFELYHKGTLRGVFNPSSGAYSTRSDRRLKQDIQSLPSIMDYINKLHPVSYRFKGDTNNKLIYGFIAQEVQEVLPGVVTLHGAEDEETYFINYEEFSALAIKGLQDQHEMISMQETEIADLRKSVIGLSQEIRRMSKTLQSLIKD